MSGSGGVNVYNYTAQIVGIPTFGSRTVPALSAYGANVIPSSFGADISGFPSLQLQVSNFGSSVPNVPNLPVLPNLELPLPLDPTGTKPLYWYYKAPYAGGLYAVVTTNVTVGTPNEFDITIKPCCPQMFYSASAQWVGVTFGASTPQVGLFTDSDLKTNRAQALLPYMPLYVTGQFTADTYGPVLGECALSFSCAPNNGNGNANPQWVQTTWPPNPTSPYAQLVPGLAPSEYVLQQVGSTSSTPTGINVYFKVSSASSSDTSAVLQCTTDLASAARVYVCLTINGLLSSSTVIAQGVVFLFEDEYNTIWTMNEDYMCDELLKNYQDVQLKRIDDDAAATSVNNNSLWVLPGFVIAALYGTTNCPFNTLLLQTNIAQSPQQPDCYMPLEVGCPSPGACYFKDTPTGQSTLYCGTTPAPPTRADIAKVQNFINNVCYALDSSRNAAGTLNTIDACALACSAKSPLGLATYCYDAETKFCTANPGALPCTGPPIPKPTTSSGPTTSSHSHYGPVQPSSSMLLPIWAWVLIGIAALGIILGFGLGFGLKKRPAAVPN